MFPPSPSIDRGNNAERWIDTVTKLREQIRLHGRTPGLPPSPTGAAGSDDEWFKVPTVNMFQNETGRGGADSWSSQEWLAAFDVLFFGAPLEALLLSAAQDDLLFFVYRDDCQESEPIFVRRKASSLPQDIALAPLVHKVDWRATCLLNVVLQSSFSLHVSVCTRSLLGAVAAAATGTMAPLGVCSISRAVFASPIQLAVNLETAKGVASQPQMSYPDICFAVDNFDDPLEGMVVQDPEECYAVVLVAWAGLTFATDKLLLPPSTSTQWRYDGEEAGLDWRGHTESMFSQGVLPAKGDHLMGRLQTPNPSLPSTSPLWSASLGVRQEGHVPASPQGLQKALAEEARNINSAETMPLSSYQPGYRPSTSFSVRTETAQSPSIPSRERQTFSDPLLYPSPTSSPVSSPARRFASNPLNSPGYSSASPEDPFAPPYRASPAEVEAEQSAPRVPGDGCLKWGERSGSASRREALTRQMSSAEGGPPHGVILFSGYVSHEQLLDAMAPTQGPGRAVSNFLAGSSPQPERAHRVVMKGPGGQGSAEVAVTVMTAVAAVAADADNLTSPFDAVSLSGESDRTGGTPPAQGSRSSPAHMLSRAVASAARTARGVAQEVLRRGGGEHNDEVRSRRRLRCALMGLHLPVDVIAQGIMQGTL